MRQQLSTRYASLLIADDDDEDPIVGVNLYGAPTLRITRTTPITDLPQLLTPEEARAFLGIGRSLIYELITRRQIPVIRLGRLVRISRDVLAGFVRL